MWEKTFWLRDLKNIKNSLCISHSDPVQCLSTGPNSRSKLCVRKYSLAMLSDYKDIAPGS